MDRKHDTLCGFECLSGTIIVILKATKNIKVLINIE